MSLQTYRYFLAVAEELNFHRAAKRLFISQQSLSAQIQKLERRYGVKLFERRPKLMLTLAGEEMKDFARRLLHADQSLMADFADLSRACTGRLRVGIPGTRGAVFMPQIWDAYHRRFPNIIVTMTEGSTESLNEQLFDGKIDLYISVNVPIRNGAKVVNLCRDRVCCVFSRSFLSGCREAQREALERNMRGFDLAKIADIPLITFGRNNGLGQALQFFFKKNDIHPNIIFESNRHDLVFELCRRGHGIGMMYEMILYQPLRMEEIARDLFVVPVKAGLLPQDSTQLVYRRESMRPKYLNGFIEVTQTVFNNFSRQIGSIIKNAANWRES